MEKIHRDRATGWKHAKLSGHSNEAFVKEFLDKNENFQNRFLRGINRLDTQIAATSIGGLHEKNVPGVNGAKTKSKTDLKVRLNTGDIVNVSIKKSAGGQVYLVGAALFIDTFEKQFSTVIPDDVQRAITLFWAAADDAVSIIETYGDKRNESNYKLQLKHKSVNATTLRNYNEHLYNVLPAWFADNAYKLAKLSFSMGAARDESEWSDFVWYINLLEEDNIDSLFFIDAICNAAQEAAQQETYYSSTHGGTTIQLPFGFVQWHHGQLQFHHSYNKISAKVKRR